MNARRIAHALLLFLSSTLLWNCTTKERDDSKTSGPSFNENIRPTEPRTPEEELAGFILPPGFEIQLFASEPDIDKPMNMTFDAKGRMWVTQSFEYPLPIPDGVRGTDRLSILEDTDGDGKADKFIHFDDTLNIPIGILPTEDGAVAFSVPYMYRFADANKDGKPESSKIMFGPFGYADTHGMVSNFIRGYDGWVHACHGFTNLSIFAGADGDSIKLVSGNTFRFRLDGSRVEQVTFGQVNPFGLAYDKYGYIYSTDSHSSPLYQLINGGDYPHFGKVPIMGFGPDMKSLTTEATALCGIAHYGDVKFPKEFQGNFFIGDVVNSRVHRYSYTWNGSSPIGKSEVDLVKSEDPWFRPVNIKLGPDGALYIADFYNAIIGHYEVPLNHPKRDKHRGRIWRITYKGDKNEKIDLSQANVDQLIAALDLDNLTTRMTATDQLTDRLGSSSVDALKATLADPKTSPIKFIHTQWALYRLGALSDETLKASLENKDALIRLHSVRILAEKQKDESYFDLIKKALADSDPHVQRAAIELLPKYQSVASVESALAILKDAKPDFDTHLIYTARLALRNILRNNDVLKEVIAKKWDERDAGFMAGVMVDVPSAESAQFLSDYMTNYKLPSERIPAAYKQIARFSPADKLSGIVDKALNSKDDLSLRSLIFKSLSEGLNERGTKVDTKLFAKWAPSLSADLFKKYPATDTTDSEEKVINQRVAIDIAGDYKVKALEPELKGFLEIGSKLGMGIRCAALRSLIKIDINNVALGGKILQGDPQREYQRRIAAVLAEFPGSAVNKSLDEVKNAPAEIQGSIVMALAGSSEGKDIIFKKIKRGELLPRTLLDPKAQEQILLKATPAQKKEYAALTANLDPIDKERQNLIENRLVTFESMDKKSFSLDSGKLIFEQNCGVCHKLGGKMGVGPQLDGIGSTGARGLVEKIIDPNRNVSRAFKSYTLKLKDGTSKTGLLRREEGQVKVYADITGKEFSINKKVLAEEIPSKLTLMPDSFGSTIPEKEFYQLINYLLSL